MGILNPDWGQILKDAPCIAWRHWWRCSSFNRADPLRRTRLDQARLRRRQQLREDREVTVAGSAHPQRCIHVDADDIAARRQPDLPLSRRAGPPRLHAPAG